MFVDTEIAVQTGKGVWPELNFFTPNKDGIPPLMMIYDRLKKEPNLSDVHYTIGPYGFSMWVMKTIGGHVLEI
jgi:hypothetical protein